MLAGDGLPDTTHTLQLEVEAHGHAVVLKVTVGKVRQVK